MIRANIHLTQKQLDALRELSGASGLPVAEIARRAIDAYIDQHQKTSKQNRPRKTVE